MLNFSECVLTSNYFKIFLKKSIYHRINRIQRPLVGYSANSSGGGSGHGVVEMPSRNFPVWTVENHEESQESTCPGRGLNRIPTEYE